MTPTNTGNVPEAVLAKARKGIIARSILSAISHLRAASNCCTDDLRGTQRDIDDEIARLQDILGALENGS